MNAFNLFPAAPTVAPEVAAANQVLSSGKQTAQLLLNTYQMSYNLVWNNKNASPDKVIAALGTSAVAVFAHAAATATFLTSLGATGFPTAIPAGWTLVSNADGSMVATKTAAPAAPVVAAPAAPAVAAPAAPAA